MPYISKFRAAELSRGERMQTPGDLAFILTAEIERYFISKAEFTGADPRFEDIAAVRGTLDTVHSEFVRRVVEPYELSKLTDEASADPLLKIARWAQQEHIRAMKAESLKMVAPG